MRKEIYNSEVNYHFEPVWFMLLSLFTWGYAATNLGIFVGLISYLWFLLVLTFIYDKEAQVEIENGIKSIIWPPKQQNKLYLEVHNI